MSMGFIYLAYVTWMNLMTPERDKLSGLYMMNKTSVTELLALDDFLVVVH